MVAPSPASAGEENVRSREATGGVAYSAATLVVAGGRSAEVVAFEIELVSFFVDAADLLGVPKSVAAIYGICFASVEPLSFSEIDERLEISTGSVSQGLRVLREVGALKSSQVPPRAGSAAGGDAKRRDYYEPDLELRNLVSRFIEKRLDRQLSSGRTTLLSISKRIPAGNGASKVLRARMKALQTWHDKARAVLPLVKTFLKLT